MSLSSISICNGCILIKLPAMTMACAELRHSGSASVSLKLHLCWTRLRGSTPSSVRVYSLLKIPQRDDLYIQLFKCSTILLPSSLEREIILSQEKIKLWCHNARWKREGKDNDSNNKPDNYVNCLFVCKVMPSVFIVFSSGLIRPYLYS